jgi:hypothetical protein
VRRGVGQKAREDRAKQVIYDALVAAFPGVAAAAQKPNKPAARGEIDARAVGKEPIPRLVPRRDQFLLRSPRIPNDRVRCGTIPKTTEVQGGTVRKITEVTRVRTYIEPIESIERAETNESASLLFLYGVVSNTTRSLQDYRNSLQKALRYVNRYWKG